MNHKICYDCMEVAKYLVDDKGTQICQSCFHKRYYRKRMPHYYDKKPDIKDLKRHFEKDWH